MKSALMSVCELVTVRINPARRTFSQAQRLCRSASCYHPDMRFLPLLLASVVILLHVFVGAQSNETGLIPCDGTDCNTEHLIQLANNVIEFLIKMLGVIAVIALVYTGFRLVVSAGNESEWGKAKEMFTNIVIGIIIILSAFLVVDIILEGLTGKGLDETTGGITNTRSNSN